ncbi:MAG: hypothetical protein LBG79_08780, partial [Spirochaetaceae bacterium]|nr:hypothetical protein [Spirochaetaceae bacterium]
MSQLHIIGVGGTGHKIVNAAVHLAACGAFKGNLGTMQSISVLTIDADDSNGNLDFTKKTLSEYHDYYNAVSAGGKEQLGLVPIEPVSQKVNLPLFQTAKKSLMTAFDVAGYKGSDMDNFIRFLYTDDEINEEFDKGFYGHTSIGTLVINDILDSSADWSAQTKNINKDDFVVVAGSIFGGTGASSIPVLLDRLASLKGKQNFSLAAIVLNPYFKTPDGQTADGHLHPDAANFNIKAKASLYYYYNQKQYGKTDALYILGEPLENYSIENYAAGADKQNNKASPIELFAATALVDFVVNLKDRTGGGIIAAKRDYDNTNKKYLYTWEMLKSVLPELPANIQNALKTAVFYNKVLYPELKRGYAAGVWLSNYNKKNKEDKEDQGIIFERLNNTYTYENIHKYLESLVCWFRDIHLKNEIDPKTGYVAKDKGVDDRVKLLNASYKTLFDDSHVNDPAKFSTFKELIYNDVFEKESWQIYHELNKQKPKTNGKIFAELFDDIHKLMSGVKAQGGGKAVKFDEVAYLSQEGNVTFAIPKTNGLWAKSVPTLLEQIANGLPVGVSKSFTKNDISIPSPWSIFITNELTLTEPHFAVINQAAFNEWCGIIALLVLRKLNHYENRGLKLEALDLAGAAGNRDFLRAVKDTLSPGSHIFNNNDWTNNFRLSLDGVTIAFLAHNTLVCPAYSLDNTTKDKLNTMAPTIVSGGEFLHPENYFKDQSQSLNKDAKSALKEFLNVLNGVITKAAINPPSLKSKLQTLTDDYIKALGNAADNPKFSIAQAKADAVNSVESLFNSLIHSQDAAGVTQLPFRLNEANSLSVLIGLNICGISSKSPDAAHTYLTPTFFYSEINVTNIAEYKKKNGRYIEKDGIKLICADEILLDSMVVIKKGRPDDKIFHSITNNSSHPDYEIIWPIDDAFLSLYTPEALNQMVSFSADNKEFTVSLEIKLDSGTRTHTVSKIYSIKTSTDKVAGGRQANGICWIMEKDSIPFWSLWPYAKIKDIRGNNTWQRYNCFCVEPKWNAGGKPVLVLEPCFQDGNPNLTERRFQSISTNDSISIKKMRMLPYAFKVKESANIPIQRGVVLLK